MKTNICRQCVNQVHGICKIKKEYLNLNTTKYRCTEFRFYYYQLHFDFDSDVIKLKFLKRW